MATVLPHAVPALGEEGLLLPTTVNFFTLFFLVFVTILFNILF